MAEEVSQPVIGSPNGKKRRRKLQKALKKARAALDTDERRKKREQERKKDLEALVRSWKELEGRVPPQAKDLYTSLPQSAGKIPPIDHHSFINW